MKNTLILTLIVALVNPLTALSDTPKKDNIREVSVRENLIDEFRLVDGFSSDVQLTCIGGYVVHLSRKAHGSAFQTISYSATTESCVTACISARSNRGQSTTFCESLLKHVK